VSQVVVYAFSERGTLKKWTRADFRSFLEVFGVEMRKGNQGLAGK
jgi:hypothetical protein